MKSKRSRTYLVSGLTLALIFVAIILVFRDVLPDIVKDLSTVPFWGVLLLLALGFAYEAMESVLCLVIIHHKKPDCTFIDALRVTFLGVFGNITTLGAGTLPMQSFYLYRRGLDAGRDGAPHGSRENPPCTHSLRRELPSRGGSGGPIYRATTLSRARRSSR